MKKVFYAAIFAVAAFGNSYASESAMETLKSAVTPSVLENATSVPVKAVSVGQQKGAAAQAEMRSNGFAYLKDLYEHNAAEPKGSLFPAFAAGRCYMWDNVASPRAALLIGWTDRDPNLGPIGDALKFAVFTDFSQAPDAFDSLTQAQENNYFAYALSVSGQIRPEFRDGLDLVSVMGLVTYRYRENTQYTFVKIEKNGAEYGYCYGVK